MASGAFAIQLPQLEAPLHWHLYWRETNIRSASLICELALDGQARIMGKNRQSLWANYSR